MADLTPEQLRALPVPPDGYAYIITRSHVLLVLATTLELRDGLRDDFDTHFMNGSESARLPYPRQMRGLRIEIQADVLRRWLIEQPAVTVRATKVSVVQANALPALPAQPLELTGHEEDTDG